MLISETEPTQNRSPRVTTLTLSAVLVFTVLLVISCGGKDSKKADEQKDGETKTTVFAVSTTTATRGELKDYLEFGGDVVAKTSVDILPDTAGKIVDLKVNVGDQVEKNQTIALVDASRAGMTYEPAPVKAPISGTITAINVVTGSMVSPQMSVAKVGKMDTLQINMNVPERFISKIKPSQNAFLRFDAYPGEIFPARIQEISPVLDQTSRTMNVKLSLTQQDNRVKAGMFARVKLITDTKVSTVKIPEACMVSRFGESFVFVVVSGETTTVRKQIVKPGIRVDDKIEIIEGLTGGDEVVVQGQTLLEEGSLVNVVTKIAPLPEQESVK